MCVGIFFVGLAAYANPTADFTLSVKQGCVPLSISFTDRSSGAVSYLWEFGNGNQSTLKNPSAIYYRSGNFTVKLTVTDANGNKSSKSFSPVRVFSNPIAQFKADTVGCIGEVLSYSDLSVKADTVINKWTWDYGDGSLSNTQNPSHAYSYSGYFSVGLTVTDGFGCKSLVNKSAYIRIKPSPKADFKLDNDYACKMPGVFNAVNTGSGAATYKWYCTDGSSGSGNSFSTNIGNYGKYRIRLVAIGSNLCSDTAIKDVLIEKLIPKFSSGNVCQNNEMQFDNQSTPDINNLRYKWDFGDGNSDTVKEPKHKYLTDGKFTVTLTVFKGKCSETISREITVNPRPDVTISIDDSIGCEAPFKAKFKLNGSDYAGAIFDFGDESSLSYYAKGVPIEHVYGSSGYFRVKATVRNIYGCIQEIESPNRVQVNTQKVIIKPNGVYGCVPKSATFRSEQKLLEDILSYEWSFGDTDVVYHTPTVNRVFYKPGMYIAELKITTVGGCIISDTTLISVGNRYEPSFKITKYDICNKDTIHFINTTPDYIKKIVTFKLIVTYPKVNDNGVLENYQIIPDSILFTGNGGKHRIKITAKHFGCITESRFEDSVNVHGPFPALGIRSLNCKNSLIALKPRFTWQTKAELYEDNALLLGYAALQDIQKKNLEYFRNSPFGKFKLKAWNDTFGCVDSIEPRLPFKLHWIDLNYQLNQACVPVKGKFSYDGSMQSFKWVFPNGDSSLDKIAKFDFKEAGNYVVKLIGYYDSSLCMDTNLLHIRIDGIALMGNVVRKNKCMPMDLELIDSAVGEDAHYHTWTVNGKETEARSRSTLLTVDYLIPGKNFVEVIHRVQSDKGCISEKSYKIPVEGPKGKYTFQRFAMCDTPVLYLKSYVDTSGSKLPVSTRWNFSNGYSSSEPHLREKFVSIGVNYFNLTFTDRNGCNTTYRDSFEVSPNMLQPQFKSNPTGRFCPPLECDFTDMSKTFNSEIVKWEWDFGDGNTSQLRNPRKLYLLPGSYDITLKVTSRSGCTATLKKPGYIIVKGPKGSYDFDRGSACLPHQVQFRGKTEDSASMEWDLGDGVVRQGNYFTHTYSRRGKYIPAMILSDTLGCKYTLPPIDTIEVFDYPQINLKADGLCFHDAIRVSQNSLSNHDSSHLKFYWYFNNVSRSPGKDSFYMPESRGMQKVQLIAENMGTCRDTALLNLRIFAPEADLSTSSDFVCVGQKTEFNNLSKSDTNITAFHWDFGDGNYSDNPKPFHQYKQPGAYDVMLIAKDIMNCYDTVFKPAYAKVGDTLAPPLVPVRRASVISDRAVELVFARYPDFDFSSYTVYRESNGRYYPMAEIRNPDDTVFNDMQCNTLQRSYCYKIQTANLCLMKSNPAESDEHCTIETKAFGLEEANKVIWTPYIGFDSIAQYQIWRKDAAPGSVYKMIASVPSPVLHFTDSFINCNTRQNYRILAIQHKGFEEFSYSDTAGAKPFYFNRTTPNYTWRTTVVSNEDTRVEWLNNAHSKWGIKAYLLDKTLSDGTPIFRNRYFDAMDTVYEDDFVRVNEKSYIYQVRGLDNCNDTTPYSNVAQSILLRGYFDLNTLKPAITWNHYQKWDQDIERYEIERKQPDGSFICIGRTDANVNVFIDMSAESNCSPEYVYRVRAISKIHSGAGIATYSLSNETNVYPHSTLFVPTAFSPDNNGINEVFAPKGTYISRYHIQIFNRWGEKVFDSHECMAGWSGLYMNDICMEGVYLYHIEALGADNKHYNLKGTFTLLR